MTGSHEVRGSIPLDSTKFSLIKRTFFGVSFCFENTNKKGASVVALCAFLDDGSAGKTRTYNPSVTLYPKLSFERGLSHQLCLLRKGKVVGRCLRYYRFGFLNL